MGEGCGGVFSLYFFIIIILCVRQTLKIMERPFPGTFPLKFTSTRKSLFLFIGHSVLVDDNFYLTILYL